MIVDDDAIKPLYFIISILTTAISTSLVTFVIGFQHFLYFLPLPQGQGSLRPTRGPRLRIGSTVAASCPGSGSYAASGASDEEGMDCCGSEAFEEV